MRVSLDEKAEMLDRYIQGLPPGEHFLPDEQIITVIGMEKIFNRPSRQYHLVDRDRLMYAVLPRLRSGDGIEFVRGTPFVKGSGGLKVTRKRPRQPRVSTFERAHVIADYVLKYTPRNTVVHIPYKDLQTILGLSNDINHLSSKQQEKIAETINSLYPTRMRVWKESGIGGLFVTNTTRRRRR